MCGVQLKDRKNHGGSNVWRTAQRQKDPWSEQSVENSSKTERSMVGAMCGEQLKDIKIHRGSNVWSSAQRHKDPWWEQCVEFSSKTERDLWWEQSVECSSKTERSMVGAMCGVQLKDRKIHGGSNVWRTAQRQKDPW